LAHDIKLITRSLSIKRVEKQPRLVFRARSNEVAE
jgi:hypothetical protein